MSRRVHFPGDGSRASGGRGSRCSKLPVSTLGDAVAAAVAAAAAAVAVEVLPSVLLTASFVGSAAAEAVVGLQQANKKTQARK